MKKHHSIRPRHATATRIISHLAVLALLAASGGSVLADETKPENKKPKGTLVAPTNAVLAVKAAIKSEAALKRLQEGNARFVAGTSTQTNKDAKRRASVAQGQKPFAIIVSCSDSRVGPEVVFDQGLGDLFVVRTAGHVVDDVGLASIEYAVEHLGASFILVLGHERCGAVAVTVAGGEAHGHVRAIVKAIKPAVAKTKGQPGDAVDNAVREHVREVAAQLKKAGPVLAERVTAGQVKVAGARYDLDTGRVQFIE